MAKGDTKTNQYLDIAANGTRADLPADTCCETRSQTLIREVAERIMDVEDEVEELKNNPDVVDIVATYADLQSYDTSQLTDKDVIRVLQDETHDGDSTYYRWSTSTSTWTYIGESKQYTDFVGTDGTSAGTAGLVPAPVATDAGYFLSASGDWEEIPASGGGMTELTTADYNYPTDNPSCVALWLLEPGIYSWADDVAFRANSSWTDQTNSPGTGIIWDAGNDQLGMAFDYKGSGHWYQLINSTTGQSIWVNRGLVNADVYQGGDFNKVRIGYSTTSSGTRTTAIGKSASATATDAIVIGTSANTSSTSATDAIVIGNSATASAPSAIVIGKSAQSNTGNGIAIGNNVKGSGIAIGQNISSSIGIAIGNTAQSQGTSAIAIGSSAKASATRGIAIGDSTEIATSAHHSVALGSYSKVTQKGEVGIGLISGSTYGYNNSNYRLLTGLYDGQSAHDAATKGQLDTAIINGGTTAPTTTTVGAVGTLYSAVVSNTAHLYACTAIDDTTDPQNPSYTWTTLV